MKRLISLIFAFAMMGATLPMSSCSDNEDKVLESLEEYSIEGEWIVVWSNADLNDRTITFEIRNNKVYVYSNWAPMDDYPYTMEGNVITLKKHDVTEGTITIEKISEEYADVKVKIRWLDDTYRMRLSRMG